jgi:phosphatidylserine/phosphatidylglycerophosphate/cardiolipin synthase-like enzyme
VNRRSDRADLSSVPDSTLERLREGLVTKRLRTPVTRAGLLDLGISHQLEVVEAALSGHSNLACLTVLDVTVAERDAVRRPAPELVWSGPERTNATARDTAVVLRELFEAAERHVVLAGYDFTQGSSLLEPLWVAMRDRGVDVHFFVHIKQPDVVPPDAAKYGDDKVQEIMASTWPFGNPMPQTYYDTRACKPRPWFNMHAKCVVVDGKVALITSANFTKRAQEQNTECGVLIHDATFAHHLARQWMGLVEAGLVFKARIDNGAGGLE